MYNVSKTDCQYKQGVALAAVFFVIWLGFAEIYHQFDTIEAHHSHHDCQQFSSIIHGLQTSDLTISAVVLHGYIEPETEVIRISRPISAYDARSPPITELSMNHFI
ncbi:DUF2607 family protein [Vibrio quintilis]|uniref:DUF2607 domain-containing protein n=1 Tax=Vibrio quintilis TaxID=1117707 RepID=A0A1M7YQQ3_9VIBR|nr:DUF2607 family protein [Vibrio quintilis]SHO54846.1 hypothetical protein VQ7734_00564 [Vibrio quintilis]